MGQADQATLKEGHSTACSTEEATQIQAWYRGSLRNSPVPEVDRATNQEASISKASERDCQDMKGRLNFASGAILALQEAAEAYLIGLFEDTPNVSQSCQRISSWPDIFEGSDHNIGSFQSPKQYLGPFQGHQSLPKVIIRKAIKSSLNKREKWLRTSAYINQPKIRMSRIR